jgi:CHAD domain-containing protein
MSAALPPLAPDVPFSEAGRAVLRHQLLLLLAALPGVQNDEPAAVHDLRVATRRLRSSLAVFTKLFPADAVGEAERQVARLAEGFSAVRDLDVQIETLRQACESLPDGQKVGIRRVIDRLSRQRTRERRSLKKLLEELEKGKLEKRLRRLLGETAE